MKKYISVICAVLAVSMLTACGGTKETAEEPAVTNVISPESETQTEAERAEISSETESEETKKSETTAETEEYDVLVASSNEDGDAEVTSVTEEYFEDSFEVYLYEVEEAGTYSFITSGEDDVPWDIYVLDEEFDEGYRYLYSNVTPDYSSDCTIELEAGKFVYCICSQNEWNSETEADSQLSIIKADDEDDDFEDDDDVFEDDDEASDDE